MQKEKVKILEKHKKTEENNSKNIQDMETKQKDKLSELNQQKSEVEVSVLFEFYLKLIVY